MTLQIIYEQYAGFRRLLGERFVVNGNQLKAFCRFVGQDMNIVDVSPERSIVFSPAEAR